MKVDGNEDWSMGCVMKGQGYDVVSVLVKHRRVVG